MARVDSYRDMILRTNGLIGYWRMGDGGPNFRDEQGRFAPATTTGSGWGYRKPGVLPNDPAASLLFDPAGTCPQVTDEAALNPTTAFTTEVWYFPTSTNQQGLLEKYTSSGGPFAMRSQSGNLLGYTVQTNAIVTNITGTTNFGTGSWHHCVFTFDGTLLNVYLDGKADASPVTNTITVQSSTTTLKIGGFGDSGGGPVLGYLQDVALYKVALTAQQVLAHYNAKAAPAFVRSIRGYQSLAAPAPGVRATQNFVYTAN